MHSIDQRYGNELRLDVLEEKADRGKNAALPIEIWAEILSFKGVDLRPTALVCRVCYKASLDTAKKIGFYFIKKFSDFALEQTAKRFFINEESKKNLLLSAAYNAEILKAESFAHLELCFKKQMLIILSKLDRSEILILKTLIGDTPYFNLIEKVLVLKDIYKEIERRSSGARSFLFWEDKVKKFFKQFKQSKDLAHLLQIASLLPEDECYYNTISYCAILLMTRGYVDEALEMLDMAMRLKKIVSPKTIDGFSIMSMTVKRFVEKLIEIGDFTRTLKVVNKATEFIELDHHKFQHLFAVIHSAAEVLREQGHIDKYLKIAATMPNDYLQAQILLPKDVLAIFR